MTSSLFDRLRDAGSPSDIVVESGALNLSRTDLQRQVDTLASELRKMNVSCVGLHLDNGIEWIISDLACQLAQLRIVPLPLFFSDEQLLHAITSAGVDTIISDRNLVEVVPGAERAPDFDHFLTVTAQTYRIKPNTSVSLPQGTQKITFTSGTTGAPKGVCLSTDQQLNLAKSLASLINTGEVRHLCLLPLSTLLENLAGLYAPLIAGGKVIAPPLEEVGLAGSSRLDVRKLLGCIERYRPNSLILVPEMLNALTLAADAGWKPPTSLDFVAVGGGKVSPEMLLRARQVGIPAYEGYGLSECASVVSLNLPELDSVGSAGRPLPHVTITTEDGEIIVTGSTFLGYANQPDSWGSESVRTGDIGSIDENGFVHVDGRLKHQLITSFGRNLSPEWVESELLSGPLLQQAIVIGDDKPFCAALVYPRDLSSSDQAIGSWIDSVNLSLPDYARIADWSRMSKPLSSSEGFLTDNGRPKRANIEQEFQPLINDMYESHNKVSTL